MQSTALDSPSADPHNGDDNPFRYSGEYYDEETGFIYLRARYYDPTIGRFISEDPIRDGINWYAYCNNNPVMYVDPSGLAEQEENREESERRTVWSLKSDSFGRDILLHWLFGNGEEFTRKNGNWGSYMKGNSRLKENVKKIVFPLADDLMKNSSRTINITTSMEIDNGEDIIGYQYLHGTNADVGGFQIKGTISKNWKGDITFDLTYVWNDRIDPNYAYKTDTMKAKFAQMIPFANPTDYTIKIIWTDTTIIKANQKWYNQNTGWLK